MCNTMEFGFLFKQTQLGQCSWLAGGTSLCLARIHSSSLRVQVYSEDVFGQTYKTMGFEQALAHDEIGLRTQACWLLLEQNYDHHLMP